MTTNNINVKCMCGCGETVVQTTKYRLSRYIKGHNRRKEGIPREERLVKCACGCGELIPEYDKKNYQYRKFKHGHNLKGGLNPRFTSPDTTQIEKIVKGWKNKPTGGCFVYLPPAWVGKEVSVSLLEDGKVTEEIERTWVVNSGRMNYVSVKCDWMDRKVLVSLVAYKPKIKIVKTKKKSDLKKVYGIDTSRTFLNKA